MIEVINKPEDLIKILDRAEIDAEFAKIPEVKDLVTLNEKLKQKKIDKGIENPEKKETGEETEKPEVEKKEEKDEKKGFEIFNVKSAKVSTPEDFNDYVSKVLSIDLSKETGYGTLVNSISTFRKQAQEGANVKGKFDELVNIFENLPTPIKNAIHAHSKAEDWRSSIANQLNAPDFDVDYDRNKQEILVKYYFPDDYKEIMDDEEDEDKEKSLRPFEKLAKIQFEKDKREYEKERDTIIKEAAEREKKAAASLGISVQSTFSKYPGIEASAVDKAKSILTGNSLGGLFFDKDGNYLPEAVERVIYIQSGEDMVKNAMKNGLKAGRLEATEDVLELKDEKIKTSKATEASSTIPVEVKAEIEKRKYSPLFKKDPFASVQ
ncbi:MAG TPA: hypothetical protein VJ184_15645 [Chryseolinea sp.]|nr:hypothetical protein [Chryseolinea sp.]